MSSRAASPKRDQPWIAGAERLEPRKQYMSKRIVRYMGCRNLGRSVKAAQPMGCASESHMIKKLKVRLTVKSEMHSGYASPPHDKNNTEMIQLIAEPMHISAMVCEGMEDCRENEANNYTEVVCANGNHI